MRALSFGFSCFSLLAASVSLSACGSSHDELSKRLAAMQADLTALQKHDDRLEERLEALELRREAAAARPVAGSAPIADHPKLLVVKLEPGDDTRDAPVDTPAEVKPEDSVSDKSPRPVIRVHGANSDGDVRMVADSDGAPDSSSRHKRGQ